MKSFQKDGGSKAHHDEMNVFRITKKLTVNQVLDLLENLSDDELPDEGVDIAIIPPQNIDEETDEDSGDEDLPKLHNLPPKQLLAEAVLIDPRSDDYDLPFDPAVFQSLPSPTPSCASNVPIISRSTIVTPDCIDANLGTNFID